MSVKNKNIEGRAFSMLGAELLFILLPFVVTGIIFSSKGDFSKLLYIPEWSLAASVLIGQAMVKFISGILANRTSYSASWERVALAISFLIVVCLVPALIVLSLILVAATPSNGLALLQVLLFILGIIVFFTFGGGGETLMRHKEGSGKDEYPLDTDMRQSSN